MGFAVGGGLFAAQKHYYSAAEASCCFWWLVGVGWWFIFSFVLFEGTRVCWLEPVFKFRSHFVSRALGVHSAQSRSSALVLGPSLSSHFRWLDLVKGRGGLRFRIRSSALHPRVDIRCLVRQRN